MSNPLRHIGSVVNGKFIKGRVASGIIDSREHTLHRQYVRDVMREDYAKDLAQPYKNGQANPEFIEAAGKEEAVNYFTQEQINESMGSL